MAIDHAPQGIRVNCVAPGPVYTPMVYADGMSEELRERRRCASPLENTAYVIDCGNGVGMDSRHPLTVVAGNRWITAV
jgi:NAD(P)-dependent dehydrogenase (short-subunit alcohol dehydrogenase family)